MEQGVLAYAGGGAPEQARRRQTPRPNPTWQVGGKSLWGAAAQPLVQGLNLPRDWGRAVWLNNGGENLGSSAVMGALAARASRPGPPTLTSTPR